MEELLLPNGFVLLTNQVAGHTFSQGCKALGMLKNESCGCVLKPLGKPQCGERELRFYEQLNDTNNGTLILARCIVPKFHGKCKLLINGIEHTFLKMEDLSHCMRRPCIMDIKIGQRTWDPLATAQKRQIEEEKYAKCKKVLGLCLPGFQFYRKDPHTNEISVIKYGKEYGKQLDASGLQRTVRLFLLSDQQHSKIRQALIQECLNQLYTILDWFNRQRLYHFYASSLLFVYDYDMLQLVQQEENIETSDQLVNGNDQHSISTTTTTTKTTATQHQQIEDRRKDVVDSGVNVNTEQFYALPQCPSMTTNTVNNNNIGHFVKIRMIDFAHVFVATDSSPDTNYMFGLKNLIQIIENVKINFR